MTPPAEPRIRDLYKQYVEGRLPFEELMAVADRRLAQFDAEYSLPNADADRIRA